MKPFLALATLLALAACGADGEPTPPVAKSGVAITGSIQTGVSG